MSAGSISGQIESRCCDGSESSRVAISVALMPLEHFRDLDLVLGVERERDFLAQLLDIVLDHDGIYSLFAEAIVDQFDHGVAAGHLVAAVDFQLQFYALARRQHHHAHDALGIDPVALAGNAHRFRTGWRS